MLKNKKAQGLSLNTVIIAAIVLIVLVILVMVFTGRMGFFTRGLWNQTGGKVCAPPIGNPMLKEECPLHQRVLGKFSGLGDHQACCKTPESGGPVAGGETS